MSYSITQWISIRCPDLASDSNLTQWIDGAKLHYDQSCYGTKYNLIVALRACHDYTVSQTQQNIGSSGGSGTVISKREGDQSITFGNNSSSSNAIGDDYLKLTNYGIEILAIKRGTILGLGVTDSNTTIPGLPSIL